MRKLSIICDCCGAPAENLNQVTVRAPQFNRNYELCENCLSLITGLLVRNERTEQRLEEEEAVEEENIID